MQVSAADRAHIVECADGGGDWKALCANLRVNPKTAHGWIKSGAQERKPHTDSRRKALTEEQDAICGMIRGESGNNIESVKGKDFGGLPIERCNFNDPQLPGRTIVYVEGALHRGRCKQCRPARGICASNQCPYAGQENYLDGRNEH